MAINRIEKYLAASRQSCQLSPSPRRESIPAARTSDDTGDIELTVINLRDPADVVTWRMARRARVPVMLRAMQSGQFGVAFFCGTVGGSPTVLAVHRRFAAKVAACCRVFGWAWRGWIGPLAMCRIWWRIASSK